MPRFSGIIFDMDGVLLHSSVIHETAYRESLAHLPVQIDYKILAGRRTDEAMRVILSAHGIEYTEDQVHQLSESKTRAARRQIAEQNPVTPGCAELLRTLATAYPLALASSASKSTVDLFLDTNDVRKEFQSILHGGDVRNSKPSPDIYLLACERLALPPWECLVIEDAVTGVLAGRTAGTVVWGIGTTSTAAELSAAGAERVLSRLDDLLELMPLSTTVETR